MDILLVNPAEPNPGHLTEHLGIAGLKSFISANGFIADTLDLTIEKLTIRDAISLIIKINPKMVGFSLLDGSQDRGFKLIKGIAEKGYRGCVITGGYFSTFSSKEILQDFPQVEFVVSGEGEITLLELMNFYFGKSKIAASEIKGLTYRSDIEIVENPARPLIADLDILPPVDRKYASQVLKNSHLRISATRGCWGQCSFCDIVGLYGTSKGKKWRRRSVEKLVDEIENLVKRFGTNYFIFNDDQFLLKGDKALGLVDEFAREIKSRNLNIGFELMCRADTVSKKVMARLREAGLKRVFLGIESFDEEQLKRFNKKISVRQNLKAVITLYNLKIDVIASVILADAYMTLWGLLKQFVVLYELKRKYFNSKNCQISINKKLEVYRGSAVYQEYKSKGLLIKDNYLTGCDYKMRFWTDLRLKLLTFEEESSRFALKPGLVLREWIQRLQLRFTH